MRALWRSAPLLLALTMLFWAANVVIGRAVVNAVPPVALSFLRWGGAFLVVTAFARRRVAADWPVLRASWRSLLLLALTGVATYNTLVYSGLHSTGAINALLLQSATPLFVLVWLLLVFREPPTWRQVTAILVSLAGVVVIAGRGSLATLLTLQLSPGDALVLAGVADYALYSALLRTRPRVHPLSFLWATFGLGSLMLLPLAVAEAASGAVIHPSLPALAAVAYVCLFPSFVAYLCFNRGVELIGAARAGQYLHLMPAFGVILAVVFLGEAVHLYHAAGIGLIAVGLVLAR